MSPSAKNFKELHEIHAPLMLGHTCKMNNIQHKYYSSNKGNPIIGINMGFTNQSAILIYVRKHAPTIAGQPPSCLPTKTPR